MGGMLADANGGGKEDVDDIEEGGQVRDRQPYRRDLGSS